MTDAMRLFVVGRLAQWRTPSEVAQEVEERFGVKVARQSLTYYDPEANPSIPDRWRAAFEEARHAAVESIAGIAIGHQGFRLGELLEIYRKAKSSGNLVLALQALEQAAKERGGAYTNRRELAGGLSLAGAILAFAKEEEEERERQRQEQASAPPPAAAPA